MVVDQHPGTSILVNTHKNLDRNNPYPGFIYPSQGFSLWDGCPYHIYHVWRWHLWMVCRWMKSWQHPYFLAQKLAIKHLDLSNKIRDTTFGNLTRYATGSPLFHVRETGSWWVFLLQEPLDFHSIPQGNFFQSFLTKRGMGLPGATAHFDTMMDLQRSNSQPPDILGWHLTQ
jgi:hypothetical protein